MRARSSPARCYEGLDLAPRFNVDKVKAAGETNTVVVE
jgi:hypothetical protein